MATRSTIAILETTGVVKQIYTHWDSYFDHNGRILKTYYKTPELVKELISNGDLSILAPNINPTGEHSFDKPQEGVCVYYGRDRGEKNVRYRQFSDFDMFKSDYQSEEYDYVYVESQETWYYYVAGELKRFLPELDEPVKTPKDLIAENPGIKQMYTDVLNGDMSYNDFCKLIETLMK